METCPPPQITPEEQEQTKLFDTFEAGLEQIPGDSDTFFVIVTRGHVYDRICLESIVRKPHAYIGMMGSHRRVAQVKHSVLENGADPQVISQLHNIQSVCQAE